MKQYRPSEAQLRALRDTLPDRFWEHGRTKRHHRSRDVLIREGLIVMADTRAFGIKLRLPKVTEAGLRALAQWG